jgi:hypothetical protein
VKQASKPSLPGE